MMFLVQLSAREVQHGLDRAYRLLSEAPATSVVQDYRRKVSRVYFVIIRGDTKTIRKGIELFLKEYEVLPSGNERLSDRRLEPWEKQCGAFDVVYALNRYLFRVPKGAGLSPLTIEGQAMALYPWSKESSGALSYTGAPFHWYNIWPDQLKEFDEFSHKFKRRSELDPVR